MMRNDMERAKIQAQSLLIQRRIMEMEVVVSTVFAVMIGLMFGILVAELAHRYFEIDLPTFF